MYRIIGADGKEYGPITADQLRQWVAEGRVNAQTKIVAEGTSEWKSLSEFPEFSPGQSTGTPPNIGTTTPVPTYVDVGGTNAEEAVKLPAIILMCVAGLGLVGRGIGFLFRTQFREMMSSYQTQVPWANAISGPVEALTSVLALVASVLMFIGAYKMLKLQNYALAMAGCIIALIPCNCPCCFVSLPIGIWALVVLSKPEVKAAFH